MKDEFEIKIDLIEYKFKRVFYSPNDELCYTIACSGITKTYKMARDEDDVWKFIDYTIDPELEIRFNKIIVSNEMEQ